MKFIIALCLMAYVVGIKKKKDVFSILIILLVFFLFLDISGKFDTIKYMWWLHPYSLMFIAILLYKVYIEFYVKARNKFHEISANTNLVTLNREIHADYNPSVVGYLLNQRLKLQDLSADIMNLFALKLIDIKQIETKKYEITLQKEEYEDIVKESDRYILNYLTNKISKFDFEVWESFVKEDYRSRNFSAPKKYINGDTLLRTMFLMLFIGTIVFTVILKTFVSAFSDDTFASFAASLFISAFIAFVYVAFISARVDSNYDADIYLSKTGQDELKKWLNFKKFITDYTLVKERNVEEIILFEKYIPYAVALGINKNFKDTIFSVFENIEISDMTKVIMENIFGI